MQFLREVCTFSRQCFLQVSYDIKLPWSSQLWLVRGLLLQLKKWLWKQMKCEKLDLMCFKSILTKMLSLVKSIATNAETSCVVVRRGPTADYEEDQRIFVSSLVMGDLLPSFYSRGQEC